jgi:hypothetical protein
MKRWLMGSALVALATFAVAEDEVATASREKARESMKETMLREYRYAPETVTDRESTVVRYASDYRTDPIVLDTMSVVERSNHRQLSAAINSPRPPKDPQNVSKFGTGIHQRDFGKVRVSAVTLFFIPVFVGASW